MLTSNEIRNRKFEKAGMRGYRADDVDNFVEEVAAAFDQLLIENESLRNQGNVENEDLKKKLQVLAKKIEEYRDEEDSLKTALLGAQKMGDSIIKESKSKAEDTIKEATGKAELILQDATIKAEKIVESSHRQVEKEQIVLNRLKREVVSFKNKLLGLYKAHLELISALPDEEEEREEKVEQPEEEARVALESESDNRVEAVAEEPVAQVVTEQVQQDSISKEEEPQKEPVENEGEDKPVSAMKQKTVVFDVVKTMPSPNAEEQRDRFIIQNISSTDEEKVEPELEQAETTVPPSSKRSDANRPFTGFNRGNRVGGMTSRFGALKFGEDYDLSKDEDVGGRSKRRR